MPHLPFLHSKQRSICRESRSSSIAAVSLEELLESDKRSRHYEYMCQEGAVSNFRVLASFKTASMPQGYLFLLEGLMMIILDTYQDPGTGTYHKWCNKVSFDFVKKLRSTSGFPPVEWKGLNGAWSCYQGFNNVTAKGVSPCMNDCYGRPTYPKTRRPTDEGPRGLAVKGDPLLGGYNCGYCAPKLRRHGRLLTADEVRRCFEKKELRKEYGWDAACACCKRLESEFHRTCTRRSGKVVRIIRRHARHRLFPRLLLCM